MEALWWPSIMILPSTPEWFFFFFKLRLTNLVHCWFLLGRDPIFLFPGGALGSTEPWHSRCYRGQLVQSDKPRLPPEKVLIAAASALSHILEFVLRSLLSLSFDISLLAEFQERRSILKSKSWSLCWRIELLKPSCLWASTRIIDTGGMPTNIKLHNWNISISLKRLTIFLYKFSVYLHILYQLLSSSFSSQGQRALPQLQMVQIHLTKSFHSPIYHANIPPLVFSLIFISISSPLYPCPQPPDMTKSMTSTACRHIKGSYPPNKLSLPPPAALFLLPVYSSTSTSSSLPTAQPTAICHQPHLYTELAMDKSNGFCSTPFLLVFSEAFDSLDNCLLP